MLNFTVNLRINGGVALQHSLATVLIALAVSCSGPAAAPRTSAQPTGVSPPRATATVVQPQQEYNCDVSTPDSRDIEALQVYFKAKAECNSAVVEAAKAGMLKGILYEPSQETLSSVLSDLLSETESDKEQLDYLVKQSVANWVNTHGEAGQLVPGLIDIFGKGVPLYVAFNESLFSNPAIRNEADRDSIYRHEIEHVKDFYEGIRLGDIYLSYDTIGPSTMGIEFLEQLMELRATYRELESIYQEQVTTGRMSVSPDWFGSQATNYRDYREYIAKNAVSDLEKAARDYQLKDFRGIIPESTNNGFNLRFNLFGVERTAVFGKEQD